MQSREEKSLKTKFFNNTFWIIAGKSVQMLISMLISLFTARYLGPGNYGIINFTSSFVIFFTAFAGLGLNSIVIRELVNNREKNGEIIGTSIVLRLIASVVSVVAICVVVFVVRPGDSQILFIAFLQSLLLIFNSFEMIKVWYQANLQSKKTAIIETVAFAMVAVYKVFLLVTGKPVEWFAFSTTFDMILIMFMLLYIYIKDGGQRFSVNWSYGKKLLREGSHIVLAGATIVIYSQMDRLMLGQMLGDAAVGIYTSALMIPNMWPFVLTALVDSARPIITELRNESYEQYLIRIKQLYWAIVGIGVLVAIVVSIFAEPIIMILYGEQYLSAVNSLRILIWYSGFNSLHFARSIWLIAEHKQYMEKKIVAIGAVVNFVLNIVLILYIGVEGAAIATLVTSILTSFIVPVCFRETRENVLLMFSKVKRKI